MEITEKLRMPYNRLKEYGPINIVAFGDSVTAGALGDGECSFETVYWNRLRKKLLQLRSDVPVNAICAGVSGSTAKESLARMERQVLIHEPDLVIVCFGLNDVKNPQDDYTGALRTIFETCGKRGLRTIFMTPNMLNTYVAEDTAPRHKEYAAMTAEIQNSGRMDHYMQSALQTAKDAGVEICDCYSRWKELTKTQDTTLLLANRINHPAAEMHELFAQALFEQIIPPTKNKSQRRE